MHELTITPVDDKNNLYYVQNVYPEEMLAELRQLDVLQLEHVKQEWQEYLPRRKLVYDLSVDSRHILSRMRNYLNSSSKREEIQLKLGLGNLAQIDSSYWLDLPGFNMSTHLDNSAVGIAMQVCLADNASNLGTCFYNYSEDKDPQQFDVRKQFEYKLNSGYIMINDQSQWHGCPGIVPDGTFRLTSYSYLYGNR
jgi:nitroreductase